MNWVPFCAASENITPLLASIPTGMPWIFAQQVTSVEPYKGLNSVNLLPSTIRAMTSLLSKGNLISAGTIPRISSVTNVSREEEREFSYLDHRRAPLLLL